MSDDYFRKDFMMSLNAPSRTAITGYSTLTLSTYAHVHGLTSTSILFRSQYYCHQWKTTQEMGTKFKKQPTTGMETLKYPSASLISDHSCKNPERLSSGPPFVLYPYFFPRTWDLTFVINLGIPIYTNPSVITCNCITVATTQESHFFSMTTTVHNGNCSIQGRSLQYHVFVIMKAVSFFQSALRPTDIQARDASSSKNSPLFHFRTYMSGGFSPLKYNRKPVQPWTQLKKVGENPKTLLKYS